MFLRYSGLHFEFLCCSSMCEVVNDSLGDENPKDELLCSGTSVLFLNTVSLVGTISLTDNSRSLVWTLFLFL